MILHQCITSTKDFVPEVNEDDSFVAKVSDGPK